jgi:uncharacterized OB-fold protein
MAVPTKPVPTPTPDSRPFFDGAREGRLMFQRCGRCGANWFIARTHCAECAASSPEWVRASGRATLVSWAFVHQKYHPAFLAETPYPIATVELAEGPRFISSLIAWQGHTLRAGLPLEVVFEDAGEWKIPKFRPL